MESIVYYTGIDLHKRSIVLHTVDETGQYVKKAKLKSNRGLLLTYFAPLPGRQRAVVESTIGWYWLVDLLRDAGIDVILAHAAGLKAIAHAKVKTDAVDAETMAQLLRAGLIPEAYCLQGERRDQRDLLRTRLRLVERKSAAENSVERVFEKFNVRRMEALPLLFQQQVRLHREQAYLLQQQIRSIERRLRPLLSEDADLRRISAIPGIGVILSQSILLEIGSIDRFEKDRRFFSYCRLVPGASNSANSRRHRSGDKAGNKYLKLAFSHAAVRAIQHYPVIKAIYQKKRRKKAPQVARNYIAKELARIVYYVLKEQKDFDGRFKGKPLRRRKTPAWPRPAGPYSELASSVHQH